MKRNDQRGFTVLELLAAMAIFGMVVAIVYSFLFMSLSIYKKVLMEGELRARGEAMYGEMISELKDALYAESGEDGQSVVYVKRADDPDRYLDQYEMRIYPLDEAGDTADVQVVNTESGALVRAFDLGSRFMIREGGIRAADGGDAVEILLIYGHRSSPAASGPEPLEMKIDSRIPLFRGD